jgi:hypothetical protein
LTLFLTFLLVFGAVGVWLLPWLWCRGIIVGISILVQETYPWQPHRIATITGWVYDSFVKGFQKLPFITSPLPTGQAGLPLQKRGNKVFLKSFCFIDISCKSVVHPHGFDPDQLQHFCFSFTAYYTLC